MGKTNTWRPSTIVKRVISVVASGNTNYTVDLPAGSYDLAIAVKSSVTGTTTSVALAVFVDSAQTTVGRVDISLAEPNDTAPIAVLALGAGAEGSYAQAVTASSAAGPVAMTPIPIPHGVRLRVLDGTSVAGELLELELIATRR